MYTRLFYGTIQSGKGEEAWGVLDDLIGIKDRMSVRR